jgi:predicted  nucleic acid-binding Zn-ribbon protein
MIRRVVSVAVFLLAAACIVALVGCAGTTGSGAALPDNQDVLERQISDIDNDILNTEEMYKANLTALQMDENTDLRREVNRLWIELEHLRSRKAALEERLLQLEAEKK